MIRFGRSLRKLIGQDGLSQDPRFTTVAARRQHRDELEKIVRTWASGKLARKFGTGCASSITSERLSCPLAKLSKTCISKSGARSLNAITRPRGRTTLLAPWIHLSKTPTSIHHDAPAIGQHTDEVLGALGLTTAALADLRAQGVIK